MNAKAKRRIKKVLRFLEIVARQELEKIGRF